MPLRQRAAAAVFVTTATFIALAPQAMAAPMPWETSKTPAAITHHTTSPATGGSNTVTALCGAPCFE
ncbi:hypothetical protein [Streptomyces spinosirectus]